MKVMTARDAKNHFGEFLDSARREPVVVTKNDRPVGNHDLPRGRQ
jgi:prevent-host-death family protein